MPQNLLAAGAAFLAAQLIENAAIEVVYARGPDTVTLRAATGKQLLRLDDGGGGVRVEWTDADFLFRGADLVLAGETITPERGDLVYVVQPYGDTLIYEVASYGGEPPWRWSDAGRTIARVHTKIVEDEAYC
jgi:hypothetical protein